MSELFPRIYPHVDVLLEAELKSTEEDFQVTEMLPFTPSGTGSHYWFFIEKRGLNTQEVAKRLAQLAGIPVRDVGYAGMKDRHAITRQSFSVPVQAGTTPDWLSLESENLHFLEMTRHDRKLRRGVLKGNHFRLVLRHCQGEPALWETRLQHLQKTGFPNYFGAQRFGHRNLQEVSRLLSGTARKMDRHQRGLLLSAARSALFNQVLAERVRQNNWNVLLAGEIVQLNGSHSIFLAQANEQENLQQRSAEWDVHPSGPLPGRGGLSPENQAALVEKQALDALPEESETLGNIRHWPQQLAAQDVDAARRALRARPDSLQYHWQDASTLILEFSLPAGVFATSCIEALLGHEQVRADRLDLCVD
ncbi:tRNA pseudouridine(13) synthase TruD [Acidithiobacillus thiooxidans]|uniref:tRNA pseudouridine synthase D n=1 Tax=Acidithiobacillus thiooxidans ATCC 19377 TaxID=637390 RepID=A0A5P9XPB2_ACITH|nr:MULTISPECIES: tRNA pseudouridine(13) synthase TruD [Acidithiobacillus]MBU2742607.1 tRNA pseudouridine(13) synthase TruD [Acidithiobacillus albertensis]MBU2837548.1 tRNA pseudouridine(13) synthase TruD [Acidithiobacillus thiooxidans]QFX94976.1 tRNA pseudouridine(13) synthase TruD [Acidithiobacillus thiooxidans ATCC 19377]